MISVDKNITDPFRIHGIDHFLAAECIGDTVEDSKISIAYGDAKTKSEFTIRISEGEIQKDPVGWMHYGAEKAILFQEPSVAEGESIATFNDIPCIALSENEINITFDIFNSIGRILAGHMESAEMPQEAALIPSIDIYCRLLSDCVKRACEKVSIPFDPKPKWPNGAPYAVCLTHDVDEVKKTYQHLSGPLKYAVLGQIGKSIRLIKNFFHSLTSGEDPYWTFAQLMAVEEKLDVRSSLYFLQEKGKFNPLHPKSFFLLARRYNFADVKVAKMIKRLDDGGWDVGIHGSYHSFKDPQLFEEEKKSLEAVLGHPVSGTRQHHLNIEFPGTWRSHEAAGLSYDCTLGFKDKPGFRWGTCMPFTPFDPQTKTKIDIVELPTIIMDTPLFYTGEDPLTIVEPLQDTVKAQGGLLTLLWHHAVFNEREFPGWIWLYKKVIEKAKEDGAWVANGADIDEWIRKRR